MIGIHPYVLNTLSSGAAEHPHLLSVLLFSCVTTDMTWMTAEWMATPRKQIAMLADCRRSPQVLQLMCIEWKWCLGHCLGQKIQMSVNYSIKPRSRCQRPAVTKCPVFYSSRWHEHLMVIGSECVQQVYKVNVCGVTLDKNVWWKLKLK